MNEAAPRGRIGDRVMLGATLLLGGQFAVRLLGVLSLAVLARLLTPTDYGIVALAFIAVDMGKKFSELQIANAMVRLKEVTPDTYDTAFTLSLLRGLIVGAALLALSEPIAVVMNQPELAAPLRWLSLIPVIEGLRSPRMVDLVRRIDFSREAVIAVVTKLVFLAIAIGLAVLWRNYWALVVGMLASSVAGVVMAHVVAPYRPRLSITHWRMFIGFGGWLTLSSLFSFAAGKLGAILVGWRLGPSMLGQYHIGDQLATMATNQLAIPFTRAAYSGLSQVAENPDRLRAAYLKTQASVLGVILPIGVGAALAAPELVMVLAGPQWGDAVIVVQIVAPVIAVTMVASGAQSLLMVHGETRAIFLCNFVNFLIRLPILIPAIMLFGFVGLLWGRVVTGTFYLVSMLFLVQRGTGEPLWRPFHAAWRSFVSGAAMTLAVLALDAQLADPGVALLDNAAHLIAKVALAMAVYGGAHLGLWVATGRPEGFERTAIGFAARAGDKLARRLRRRGA